MELGNQLPLTEATFFILLSLVPEPRHGYAILKDVQALSEGRMLLNTGTHYGAIKRLLALEWITRVDDPLPNSTERQREVYTMTVLGRSILVTENIRLQQMASKAALRLSGDPS